MSYLLSFDGVDDHIVLDQSQIGSTIDITVVADFNSQNRMALFHGNEIGHLEWGRDGQILFSIRIGGTWRAAGRPLPANGLHTINCGFNGDNVYIQVDGGAQNTFAVTGVVDDTTGSVVFGKHNSVSDYYFDGELHQLTVTRDVTTYDYSMPGTGNLITSAAGNGTLTNFPTDDSQWIDTAVPTVVLGANPQLGATLSFTYANYAGIPVGPLAFDQGARSLPDEAVTITDNGDGSGSGVTDTVLPGLPANGASVTPFPLIGENITITLPDPGA